jgi:hypothetical protein
MTLHGRGFLLLSVLAFAFPLMAQTEDDRITQLEKRLDDLQRQADQIRQELRQLRPAEPAAPAEAEPEDLTKIDVTTPGEAAPAATQTQPADIGSLAGVQTVDNQVSPGAARALNPDISVIGTFFGHAGDRNEFDVRDPLALDEAEVAYEAFIDPYAKGRFFISLGPDTIDLEEGYAQFVTLPWGLTAKAGKTKASFGKANTWHTHVRPWVDQPLMITRFFGDEGLADVGVSVSKVIDNPFGTFIEATGEVYSGNSGDAFARATDNDLFYNAHLKVFRDLTENSNLEVGTSWARGTLPETAGHNQFTGVDVTYRWKPLMRSIYNSMIVRFEGLANRRSDFDRSLYGYYVSADYQLAQRWFAGGRFDRADRLFDDGRARDHALSATLTFWPSEFSQVRGQLRRTKLAGGPTLNEVLLQLQFAIGAHGAHAF